jgi:para-nitrobenzyl esterase
MPLFFRTVGRRPDHPDSPDFRRNAEIMSSALVSFARCGNPNEAGDSTVSWPAYTRSGQEQLVIGEDAVEGATRPRPERIAAWDGVITTERTDPWGKAFA